VLPTNRERRQRRLTTVPALIRVAVAVETDDARPPHFRRLPGHSLHQLRQLAAVSLLLRVAPGCDVLIHAGIGRLRLVLRHWGLVRLSSCHALLHATPGTAQCLRAACRRYIRSPTAITGGRRSSLAHRKVTGSCSSTSTTPRKPLARTSSPRSPSPNTHMLSSACSRVRL